MKNLYYREINSGFNLILFGTHKNLCEKYDGECWRTEKIDVPYIGWDSKESIKIDLLGCDYNVLTNDLIYLMVEFLKKDDRYGSRKEVSNG